MKSFAFIFFLNVEIVLLSHSSRDVLASCSPLLVNQKLKKTYRRSLSPHRKKGLLLINAHRESGGDKLYTAESHHALVPAAPSFHFFLTPRGIRHRHESGQIPLQIRQPRRSARDGKNTAAARRFESLRLILIAFLGRRPPLQLVKQRVVKR